jgi:uncharacterized protein
MTPALQLVHLRQTPAQPWHNGGGLTRELLTWPTSELWQLRISVADIDRDGPFSSLSGVQRWISVIDGEGMRLGSGGQWVTLTSHSAPWTFHGDLAPDCFLLAGPTRDLNLMHRGGRAQMQRVPPGVRWRHNGPWRAVFCREVAALHRGDDPVVTLPAMTLAWATDDTRDWRLDPPATADLTAWWLAYTPASTP